jgi:TPR repeat protein
VILATNRPAVDVSLEWVSVEPMGSRVRGTLIPLNLDADLLMLFQGDSPYDVMKSYGPDRLVDSLGSALRPLGRPTRVWKGEAVTVGFDDGLNIDVFPAFRFWDNPAVHFPKQGNVWLLSTPQRFDAAFAAANELAGGRLADLVKCLKTWNIRSSRVLPSFHLEAIAMRQPIDMLKPLPEAVKHFFLTAAEQGPAVLSVPLLGVYDDVASLLSQSERVKVLQQLSIAASNVRTASRYEAAGRFLEANLCWRRVFGPQFPGVDEAREHANQEADVAFRLARVLIEESQPQEAERWFRSAAETGHPMATYGLAQVIALTANRRSEADEWLELAAERGVAAAAMDLGKRTHVGAPSKKQSNDWLARAAELGDARAMLQLAQNLYREDRFDEAERWYRKSAKLGLVAAMTALGSFLIRQPKHTSQGLRWLTRAARKGETAAMILLGQVLARDEANRKKAERWLRKASDQQNLQAMFLLAELIERDAGRQLEAVSLYRTACKLGHKEACVRWTARGRSEEAIFVSRRGGKAKSRTITQVIRAGIAAEPTAPPPLGMGYVTVILDPEAFAATRPSET